MTKTERLELRISSELLKACQQAAEADHRTLSDWVRMQLMLATDGALASRKAK